MFEEDERGLERASGINRQAYRQRFLPAAQHYVVHVKTVAVHAADAMVQQDHIKAIYKPHSIVDKEVRLFVNLNGTLVDPAELKKRRVILEPPGAFLARVADFLCSKKNFTSIVKPHIADMQFEYFEALSKGRRIKAEWIRVRETIRFFYVLGVHRVLKAIAGLFSHPKMPQ